MGQRELFMALVGLLLFALGAWCATLGSRLRLRRRARLYNERGRRGELRAEKLLRKRGYAALERQVRSQYEVRFDEELLTVSLQADFLVTRAGRTWVAEVKTGKNAPRFEYSETRRQLLEYQLAFDVEGVLLVDVEADAVHEVEFPRPRAIDAPARGGLGLLCLALLASALWWLRAP